MASIVAKACNSTSQDMISQEKGSRNKRKFRADTPISDPHKIIPLPQNEYEFTAEKFEIMSNHGHSNGCNICSIKPNVSEALKLELGLSSSSVGPTQNQIEELQNADWSDLTETQLEQLVLNNLDMIFKSAIKKIMKVSNFTEEEAIKAVLKSGLCYGCKDTVTNIVDNTLSFIKSGQENDHFFEDLKEMEKYILAELVCVLREVRPFFSTGDAMWCLLICDMNVSQACGMDSEFNNLIIDEKNININPPQPFKLTCTHNCLTETHNVTTSSLSCGHTFQAEANISNVQSGQSGQSGQSDQSSKLEKKWSNLSNTDKPFNTEEKYVGNKRVSGIAKREYILRQKSLHLEKHYRSYGSKSGTRSGKITSFGGLVLDKKLKSVSESKKIVTESGNNSNILTSPLTVADTELSLGFPAKSGGGNGNVAAPVPISFSAESSNNNNNSCSVTKWVPQDRKDEMIMKLVPRARELQNQLQEWTEWANQKVMQAAKRLGKDKVELKALKQEKDEIERLKKEKLNLEENTMKKLSEMDNALGKAFGQVARAQDAVNRLNVENKVLRREMEIAKLRAAESALSCQEVTKREKLTLMKIQSWEKQKSILHEELLSEKRSFSQLKLNLDQAKNRKDLVETKWKQEEKTKEEILEKANLLKKEREEIENSTKLKTDIIKSKAERNLKKYKNDIEKLEKQISEIRLKTDSSKIAALRNGIDGSYASKVGPGPNVLRNEISDCGGVKRERECVMCLSEEMTVVFLPCAHQVVCKSCNELHEKQGMKDCPSCRSIIQRRINVRFARS